MTDDLVKRLRRDLASEFAAIIDRSEEAADRIEELEKALVRIARAEGIMPSSAESDASLWHLRTIATAAIEGKKYD